MGNALSGNLSNNDDKLMEKLDQIAADLIINEDFNELKKLYNKKYCQKLQILTSSILSRKFKDVELQKLKKRIKLNDHAVDFTNNSEKKQLCKNIAKFYVKIGHLYSAILATINPVYSYTSNNGVIKTKNLVKKKLFDKKQGDRNQNIKTDLTDDFTDDFTDDVDSLVIPEQAGLCSKRIQTLLSDYVESENPNEKIKLKPLVCDKQYEDSTILDETGIPELFNLYKDVYNPNIGRFYEMSPEARKQYNKDVKMYYLTVTGNKTVPKELGELNFSKIKLKDYATTEKCIGDNAPFQKEYTGTIKEKLFRQYIDHIKEMIRKTNRSKGLLIDILQQVFSEKKNSETGEKKVFISPTLTMRKLEKLIIETRKIIVKLYIDCETDFEKGLQIFEAIVEKVKFDTSVRRIDLLNKNVSELTSDPFYPSSDGLQQETDREYQQDTEEDDDEINAKNAEKDAEEIAAQKSCLRYPGWRKYTDATGRSIWVDPENPNKFYGNLFSNIKNPKNTAVFRDMELCNKDKESRKKCDDTQSNWVEIFKDNTAQKTRCYNNLLKSKFQFITGETSEQIVDDDVDQDDVDQDDDDQDDDDQDDDDQDDDKSTSISVNRKTSDKPVNLRPMRERKIKIFDEDGLGKFVPITEIKTDDKK